MILSGLTTDAYQQESLFEEPPDPRQQEIIELMDNINMKPGRDIIRLATVGANQRWGMMQEHLSPRCTTQWSEWVRVK